MPKQKNNNQSNRTLTPEEQAIVERINAEDGDWGPIREDELNDFSLTHDAFALPPEAAEMQGRKEYAFRWAERIAQRIDELKNAPGPFAWRVCNMTTTPFLKKYIDPIIGGVLRMDQILMYKPWRMHEIAQKIKTDLADAKSSAGEINKRHGVKDEEKGVEYLAGEKYKISSSDVVMADEGLIDGAGDSEFGDLIVEE